MACCLAACFRCSFSWYVRRAPAQCTDKYMILITLCVHFLQLLLLWEGDGQEVTMPPALGGGCSADIATYFVCDETLVRYGLHLATSYTQRQARAGPASRVRPTERCPRGRLADKWHTHHDQENEPIAWLTMTAITVQGFFALIWLMACA
jgi:hypothetical protein